MNKLLAAMFVALLMAANGSSDLDDKETRNRIIAEAIDGNTLQERGKDGEQLYYAPNQETPYTGWAKEMYDNGQIEMLAQIKDGKPDGLSTRWHKNGQISTLSQFKDGKKDDLSVSWYSNGKKSVEGSFKDDKLISRKEWTKTATGSNRLTPREINEPRRHEAVAPTRGLTAALVGLGWSAWSGPRKFPKGRRGARGNAEGFYLPRPSSFIDKESRKKAVNASMPSAGHARMFMACPRNFPREEEVHEVRKDST